MSFRPYLGINVAPESAEEVHQRGLLAPDEYLLAIFDGVLLDENNRRIGGLALSDFVALTDKRLILWARGFFNDTVDGFAWADVDVDSAETWDPFHGRVRFALRLPMVAPRTRRINLRGESAPAANTANIVINTLDFVPADDVKILEAMVAWVGDQAIAGLSGEAMLEPFSTEFPQVERQAPPAFFATPSAPPPPEPPAEAPVRKRWWQFGKEPDPAAPPAGTSPSGLIAAYENRREGGAAAPRVEGVAPGQFNGPMAGLPEQPSVYDVTRSLRLMLEAPRRLARSLRRATDVVSGTGEILNNMQDPRVRRTALAGARQAVQSFEAQNGPLAAVGPLARAVIAFSEPVNEASAPSAEARRIQVRANVRGQTSVPVETTAQEAIPPVGANNAPTSSEPARGRPISIRRGGQPSEHAPSDPAPRRPIDIRRASVSSQEPPAPPPAQPATNVRRIVINRAEE